MERKQGLLLLGLQRVPVVCFERKLEILHTSHSVPRSRGRKRRERTSFTRSTASGEMSTCVSSRSAITKRRFERFSSSSCSRICLTAGSLRDEGGSGPAPRGEVGRSGTPSHEHACASRQRSEVIREGDIEQHTSCRFHHAVMC